MNAEAAHGKSTSVFDHCTSLFLLSRNKNHVPDALQDWEATAGLAESECLWRRCKTKRTIRCSGGNLQRSRKPHPRGWESPGFTHGEDVKFILPTSRMKVLFSGGSVYIIPQAYRLRQCEFEEGYGASIIVGLLCSPRCEQNTANRAILWEYSRHH